VVSSKWATESDQYQATRSVPSGVRRHLEPQKSDQTDNIAIEVDDDTAPYAVAGQNVTLYLAGIDPIHLAIGSVLCPTSQPVPLVTKFTAQILVFDLQSPIITGTAVSPLLSCKSNTDVVFRLSYSTTLSISQLRSPSYYQSTRRAAMFAKDPGQHPSATHTRSADCQGPTERRDSECRVDITCSTWIIAYSYHTARDGCE
jgi:hypothetical protein